PEAMAPDLLAWSNAMVGMYMAGRTRETEDRAAKAARDFADFLRGHIDARRATAADDLITHLIAAEEDGTRLTTDEMISTCILLLNAGHEATVHTLGNGVKTLLETGTDPRAHDPARLTEEVLRHDPPLHLFTRHAYEDVEVHGMTIREGTDVGLLLAAANRDPAAYPEPSRFDPARFACGAPAHVSLGAGIHFCVGAPLARLEISVALRVLWERLPGIRLAVTPEYANVYHFHGLRSLVVDQG
ncbi:MAG: cytochrome P450, partial [Chloroflexi bacterium]|nr:cytochrome P450 [Chloroflexota bacterium]